VAHVKKRRSGLENETVLVVQHLVLTKYRVVQKHLNQVVYENVSDLGAGRQELGVFLVSDFFIEDCKQRLDFAFLSNHWLNRCFFS